MRDDKTVWSRLREFLYAVSTSQSRDELLHRACFEIQRVIPFDTASAIFSTSDGRVLDGTGPNEAIASFNDYFRTRQPRFRRYVSGVRPPWTCIVDWRKFDNLEIATDYLFVNGMYKSLGCFLPGHSIAFRLQRSRLSSTFLESDVAVLGCADEGLNCFYSSFDRKTEEVNAELSWQGIFERFRVLSRREAEVCSLVARRLTSAEIGAWLFVSTRTVEKHIQNVFDKLEVHSREQLRWRLGTDALLGAYPLVQRPISR